MFYIGLPFNGVRAAWKVWFITSGVWLPLWVVFGVFKSEGREG